MHPSTWWGLRRSTYFRLVETDTLAAGIPERYWVGCKAGTPVDLSDLVPDDDPANRPGGQGSPAPCLPG
jgi:hypothetical protein